MAPHFLWSLASSRRPALYFGNFGYEIKADNDNDSDNNYNNNNKAKEGNIYTIGCIKGAGAQHLVLLLNSDEKHFPNGVRQRRGLVACPQVASQFKILLGLNI